MNTVSDILKFLETLAPQAMKMEWDNVGLLCGRPGSPVTRVLVALDPFEGVCREAKAWGAELIVTHHPLIFQPVKAVTDQTALGRSILLLCENGISAINAHTNLDCAPGGVNDILAQRLGLRDIQVMNPQGVDSQGREWGLLRCGNVEEQPLERFLAAVKERLGCEGVRYVSGGVPVKRAAVGGGACAGALAEAKAAGCDTFVTSDVKYNQFWDAYDLGMNLIDAGHFATENPVTEYLCRQIAGAFPDLEVKISQNHSDVMRYC